MNRNFYGYLYGGRYDNISRRLNPDQPLREWELVYDEPVTYVTGITITNGNFDTTRTLTVFQSGSKIYSMYQSGLIEPAEPKLVGAIAGQARRIVVDPWYSIHVVSDRGVVYKSYDGFDASKNSLRLSPLVARTIAITDIASTSEALVFLSRDGDLLYHYCDAQRFDPIAEKVVGIYSNFNIGIHLPTTTGEYLALTRTGVIRNNWVPSRYSRDVENGPYLALGSGAYLSVRRNKIPVGVGGGLILATDPTVPTTIVSIAPDRTIIRGFYTAGDRIIYEPPRQTVGIAYRDISADAVAVVAGTAYFLGQFK